MIVHVRLEVTNGVHERICLSFYFRSETFLIRGVVGETHAKDDFVSTNIYVRIATYTECRRPKLPEARIAFKGNGNIKSRSLNRYSFARENASSNVVTHINLNASLTLDISLFHIED